MLDSESDCAQKSGKMSPLYYGQKNTLQRGSKKQPLDPIYSESKAVSRKTNGMDLCTYSLILSFIVKHRRHHSKKKLKLQLNGKRIKKTENTELHYFAEPPSANCLAQWSSI